MEEWHQFQKEQLIVKKHLLIQVYQRKLLKKQKELREGFQPNKWYESNQRLSYGGSKKFINEMFYRNKKKETN